MRKLNLWAILLMAIVAFASCSQAPKAEKLGKEPTFLIFS